MIGTRFYRGPIKGLDSVLPGANSERALTESWRAREPLTPAKGFAGVRHHRLNVSATRCTTHKLSKKGRGRPASLHLAGSLVGLPHARLACHCEAKCCVSLPAHCKECAPCKARKHECSECCVSLPAHSKECAPLLLVGCAVVAMADKISGVHAVVEKLGQQLDALQKTMDKARDTLSEQAPRSRSRWSSRLPRRV